MLLTTTSERQGRAIDHDQAASHGEEEAGRVFLMADSTTPDAPTRRDELIAEDIDAYLRQHQHKSLLRFITCGSVDDGKSTLIGRLLYDSQDDLRGSARGAGGRSASASAPRARTSISRCWWTVWPRSASRASPSMWPIGSSPPISANSSSPTRPGHEQYTRNMVTGASTADLAVHPDRCAQGRADADPAAHAISCICSASATSCWRSTRWTWSATNRALTTRSSPITAPSPQPSASTRFRADSDFRASPATTSRRARRNTPWYQRPDPDGASGDACELDADRRDQAKPVPHAGAMGQPAEPGFPRLLAA